VSTPFWVVPQFAETPYYNWLVYLLSGAEPTRLLLRDKLTARSELPYHQTTGITL
jgi:hypothetical protein